MADVYADGNTRVFYVAAISNIAAPTTTELNAGIRLDTILTKDGLMGFEPETAPVDTTSLSATFNTSGAGRDSFDKNALRFKKQTATDTIYNTLTKGTVGNIVIRRSIAAGTAWASSQPIEVYPFICGQTKKLSPEENTLERYDVPVLINSEPNLRATVA